MGDPVAPWPHAAITTFGPGNHAVRTARWRLIRYADGSEELYDHDRDAGEWNALAGHEAVRVELREHLPAENAVPVDGSAGAGLDAMRAAGAAAGER